MARRDDNHWIVSAHKFFEHQSPDAAEAERLRLSEKHPEKTFHIYRIKRLVVPEPEPAEQVDA